MEWYVLAIIGVPIALGVIALAADLAVEYVERRRANRRIRQRLARMIDYSTRGRGGAA